MNQVKQMSQSNYNSMKYLLVLTKLKSSKDQLRKKKKVTFDFAQDEKKYGQGMVDQMSLFVTEQLEKKGYLVDLIRKETKSGYSMSIKVYLYEDKETSSPSEQDLDYIR